MKILAFTDIHGDLKLAKRIVKLARKGDVIVCCGDFTMFEKGMRSVLRILDSSGKDVLIIPGNHEGVGKLRRMCSKYENIKFIHRRVKVIKDVVFVGYGSGGFSLVDVSMENFFKKNKYLKKYKNKKIVFVCHAPPYMTKLDLIEGEHCGNKTLREVIERIEPDVVICGHFHENMNKKDKIKETLVINPGARGKFIKI